MSIRRSPAAVAAAVFTSRYKSPASPKPMNSDDATTASVRERARSAKLSARRLVAATRLVRERDTGRDCSVARSRRDARRLEDIAHLPVTTRRNLLLIRLVDGVG